MDERVVQMGVESGMVVEWFVVCEAQHMDEGGPCLSCTVVACEFL